jgi:hypothetical protein
MTIPSWPKIRQCPRSPVSFPSCRCTYSLNSGRHNSSQQPTTCRSSARRFRSSGATRCVAPLARVGTWRLSERTLGRPNHGSLWWYPSGMPASRATLRLRTKSTALEQAVQRHVFPIFGLAHAHREALGSGFLLRLCEATILVTAAHVLRHVENFELQTLAKPKSSRLRVIHTVRRVSRRSERQISISASLSLSSTK